MDFPLSMILGGRTRRPMPGDPDYEAWAAGFANGPSTYSPDTDTGNPFSSAGTMARSADYNAAMAKRAPELFDLPTAMMLGETPKPWEGAYTPDVDEKFRRATAGVGVPNDVMPPAKFFGPSLPPDPVGPVQVLPERPLLAPGAMRNPSPLEQLTKPAISYPPPVGDPYESKPAPREEALAAMGIPVSPTTPFKRTFTSDGGTRTYDMAPDMSKYLGTYTDERGLPQVMDAGQSNLDEQRIAAAKVHALGNPLIQGQLENDRVRGEFAMKAAEAAHQHALSNKLMEMGMLAAEAIGPDATPSQRKAKVNETLGLFSGFAGGPRPLDVPQTTEVQDVARNRIGRIFAGKDPKTPFMPSDQSARALLDTLGISEGADREASIAEAVNRTKAHPQMTDELVRLLAGDLTRVAPLENDEAGGLPSQYVDKKFGMPFNLAQDKGYGSMLGRAPGLLTGNTEAFYNRAILPNGQAVTLPASVMGGMLSRANQSPEERQARERRLAAGKLLLQRIFPQGN